MSHLPKLLHTHSWKDASNHLLSPCSPKQLLFSKTEPQVVSITAPHKAQWPGGS